MADPVGSPLSTTGSLSDWASPYVTRMLGKGEALSNQPYQAYSGPLTAGPSNLQTQAFQGIAGLTVPSNMGGFNPQSFTGAGYAAPTAENTANSDGMAAVFAGADPTAQQAMAGQYEGTYTPASDNTVQQYMTPYLQGALQPQYDAANRQALISAQNLQSQYGKAGAYGGGRQAVAEAELQRGLLDRMAGITGTGYQNAFNQAQSQFNTEQSRDMSAQNLTNQFGLAALGAQQGAGALERGIEQEGIGADYAQFTEERDNPYKQVQYQQSLLQGLPIETQKMDYIGQSDLAEALGIGGTMAEIYRTIFPAKKGDA